MYSNTTSSVKLNNIFTKWFDTTTGATLFNILLNDLITDLEQFSAIDTDYFSLSVLCYTEDIVILCNSEEKLQLVLNHVAEWCLKWCLKVNTNKSKVLHVRPKRLVRTEKDFVPENKLLDVVNYYKYLGFYFDEFMDLSTGINILRDLAGRTLGAVISKFISLRVAGFLYIYQIIWQVCGSDQWLFFWNLGSCKKLGDK